MTLQQLRYVILIAECGSMRLAADKLFVSQPNLSKAIRELESEMKITIFARNTKGVLLTDEGLEFISYARQVVEQSDFLEGHYKKEQSLKRSFAVSSQHYAFVVQSFVELVRELGKEQYEFSLRECRTFEIIDDVKKGRSEIGVLYFSKFNENIMKMVISNAGLKYSTLFTAKPHIFVSRDHPLATRKKVTLEDLREYPRFTYDQGLQNSFYYSEELHSTESSKKSVVVSDRATLFNLLRGLGGYTISSGIVSRELNDDNIISIPLESNELMTIVYIYNPEQPLKPIAQKYIDFLKQYASSYTANT